MAPDIVFIVNPRAGGGRTRRRWPRIETILRGRIGSSFDVRITEATGRATDHCREALREGASTVACVGGDGTLNEVVNGYLDEAGRPRNPEARLAILPIGTGCDFSKTLGAQNDPATVARQLAGGRSRLVDAGRFTFRSASGTSERYFVNVAEFGSGGAVVDRVNRTTKMLGGRMSFLLAILRTMPRYVNTRISYAADGGPSHSVVVNDVIVANGRYFGAGLQPAPYADLEDGALDVVIVGDLDFRTIRRNLPALREGQHLELPGITTFRVRRIDLVAGDELIDLDGEVAGRGPIRFEVVPRALRFVV